MQTIAEPKSSAAFGSTVKSFACLMFLGATMASSEPCADRVGMPLAGVAHN
jgi:hypothetical protein